MNRIKELLTEKNISQVELAERLNLSRASITQLLKIGNPRLETLFSVAHALNVPVWELLVSREEMEKEFSPAIFGSILIGGVIYTVKSLDDFNRLLGIIENAGELTAESDRGE